MHFLNSLEILSSVKKENLKFDKLYPPMNSMLCEKVMLDALVAFVVIVLLCLLLFPYQSVDKMK